MSGKKVAIRVVTIIVSLVVVLALMLGGYLVYSAKKQYPEAKVGDIIVTMLKPSTWAAYNKARQEPPGPAEILEQMNEFEAESNKKLPQFAGTWTDEAGQEWKAEYEAAAQWVAFTRTASEDISEIYYVQLKKDGTYGLLGPDSLKIDEEPVWLTAKISNRVITADAIGTLKQK